MKLVQIAAVVMIVGTTSRAGAQDAAQPAIDLGTQNDLLNAPAPTPSNSPVVPELSKLDEAFKQTSLGQTADEYRLRIEVRRLQNRVVNDPAVVAAKAAAESAPTDLQKRQALRNYYNIYYGRMRSLASDSATQATLEKLKTEHLALLSQPHVRHETDAALPKPSASPTKHKEKKKKKFPH
jgi:hypothetical protein